MHTPTEQLLADLGIPVESCPTCDMSNWEFNGAVDVGITSVTCRTCGRRYEIMDGCQEMAWHLRSLARMMEYNQVGPAVSAWGIMVATWYDRERLGFSARRPLCTKLGWLESDYDDAPF